MPYYLRKGTDEERFWFQVVKTDSCWLWHGKVTHYHATMKVDGKQTGVHRYSYFLAHGEWPEPMCLHSCDVRSCVNPAHLRAGTHQDNLQDMRDRERFARGSRHGMAKLTEKEVSAIKARLAAGETGKSIAAAFGTTVYTVSLIKLGRIWTHVQ